MPISMVSMDGSTESDCSGIAGFNEVKGAISSCASGVMLSRVSFSLSNVISRLGSRELVVIPSAEAYSVVVPGCDGAWCSSSELSLSGVAGGIGVPINIPRGYGDSIIPDRIPSIVSSERCGSGMWSPGLVGEIELSLG